MYQIIIIGGGLAGLVSSVLLKRAGLKVALIEKNTFPHHKVCGEYISNEVKPFLTESNLFPTSFDMPEISKFILSSVSGKIATIDLDLGGFGLSRYHLDDFLYKQAAAEGVVFFLQKQAKDIAFKNQTYQVKLNDGTILESELVIGAHGKRSVIDKSLNRDFLKRRSGFLGVKYHIKTEMEDGCIALHNFDGGYCGISKIENNTYNLCYLGRREHLKKYGSIEEMEKNILFKNPHLKEIFTTARFIFPQPLVINEFSFEKKKAVERGVLMAGDAAGLITPLCGNGMALAIHSAKILAEIIVNNYKNGCFNKERLFNDYEKTWNALFAHRLWTGRQVQHLFGSQATSKIAVFLINRSRFVARQIIKNTHGKPF